MQGAPWRRSAEADAIAPTCEPRIWRRAFAQAAAATAASGASVVDRRLDTDLRVEANPTIGLTATRAGDQIGPLGHLMLEAPDVGVLRRKLDRLGATDHDADRLLGFAQGGLARSTSSEKIEVRLASIWTIVLLFRT